MPTITEFKAWLNNKYPKSVSIYNTEEKLVTDLNDAQDEIYIDLDNRLGNDYKLSSSIVTVANQLSYDLPSDCLITNIVKIEVENLSREYEEYKKIGIAEYLPYGKYYTRGETGKFNLYSDRKAITTAGLTIKIYYYPNPTTLSSSNMSTVPDLNVKYHNLYKYKLAQKCASTGENPDIEIANYYEICYQEYLAKVKEEIQSNDATCGELGNQVEERW